MNEVAYDAELCYEFTSNNRDLILQSKNVHCYYCWRMAEASKVVFQGVLNHEGQGTTGCCPHCGRDTLVPDAAISLSNVAEENALFFVNMGDERKKRNPRPRPWGG